MFRRPFPSWARTVPLGLFVLTIIVRVLAEPPALPWEPIPSGRRAAVRPKGSGEGFTPLDPTSLGIRWTNHLSAARYASRQNLMNGAGVALADIDGDGWCDVFLCDKEGSSGLFRNLGGWQFTNVTELAGVSLANLMATGAVFGDVNGDGRPDLFVTSFLGPDALLLNLGGGRFTNVTVSAGVSSKGGTTSAAFADVDGDGDLDLYVAHFGIEAILRDGAAISTRNVGGQPVVTGRFARRLKIVNGMMEEYGDPDVLLLNDGKGRFTPCPPERFTDEDGRPLAEMPTDFGLSVMIRDLDGNGTPDIYLANDFQTPDRIWLGDGRGNFRAAPRESFRTISYASMGVDCADIDRDGRLDIFTVEMLSRDPVRNLAQRSPLDRAPRPAGPAPQREEAPRNVLQWNRGDGTYADIAWFAGVAMSDWSWTPIFLDVDLDGFEDILVSNGHMHDVNDLDVNATRSRDPAQRARETAQQVLLSYPRLATPKAAWRNRGNLHFEDRSAAWHFDTSAIAHGMALADLDNDGDLDVVANAWNQLPLLFRNEADGHRVGVRLVGPPGNPTGAGSRVRLLGGAVPIQEQEMRAGGRYLSCDQPQLMFAAGNARSLTLEIAWRDGRTSTIAGLEPEHIYEIDESKAPTGPVSAKAAPAAATSTFVAAPPVPALTHTESDFDDFARQPLLPRRLGRLGPEVAAIPEKDGAVVVLGNGRGQRLQTARIDRQGQATPVAAPDFGPLPDDTAGLLATELVPGRPTLLVALARLESESTNPPAVVRFDRVGHDWTRGPDIAGTGSSPGRLAAGDLDGDGAPDLVVAGRFIPGRYPEPADTRVFRNDHGALVPDLNRSAPLARAGLVTDLAIADLNGDQRADLILACEWGPIRIFLGEGESWKEVTDAWGFAPFTGLWQSVAVGDLDGDGRLDIVAGNWGLNSAYQRYPAGPWELTYADFDGDGRVSIVEAAFSREAGRVLPLRRRDALARELPWLAAQFPNNHDYARASVAELLGSHAGRAQTLRATTLASAVFLRRGDRFERRELPAAAQWTPIPGLATGDFDGDGRLDVVAAQNLFALRDEDDRLDAGQGLLLRNRGGGDLVALRPSESGIAVFGEQRAVVTKDLNGDGAPDVILTQSGGPARIYFGRPPR